MGMPLSYFSAFWAAQKPERPGHHRAVELFRCFSALAFVLYDPVEDPELHRRLHDEWQMFDDLTGEHLLFFAPVDPPTAWAMEPQPQSVGGVRLVRKRLSTGPDRISQQRSLMPLVSQDPSQTTAALRQLLGVPYGMGSSLVIVRDVHAERAWLLSTGAARIGAQLERLGAIASLASRKSMPTAEFETYVARLAQEIDGLVDGLGFSRTIAEILTEACAISAAGARSTDGITALLAQSQLRQTVRDRASKDPAPSEDTAIADFARTGALVAAMTIPEVGPAGRFMRGSKGAPEDRHEIAMSLFRMEVPSVEPVADRLPDASSAFWADVALPVEKRQRRTIELMRMGDKCLALMEGGEFGEDLELDYRMPVSLWAQALEHEMAELLGHEVRNGLGVKLPDFHWRKQPGLQGIAIECDVHNGPIPFNQARPQSPDPDRAPWQPPAMGPLRIGWEVWRTRSGAPAPRELLDLLLRCKELRNAASHAGAPIPLETAHEARSLMNRSIELIGELGIRSWGG
jgi:hypothetical protein